MSVNRDMRRYLLQRNHPVRSPSGAFVEQWEDVGYIDVAVYKKGDAIMYTAVKYNDCSHVGLTYCKEIKEEVFRLKRGERLFLIKGCDTCPRRTSLVLKEVCSYGG